MILILDIDGTIADCSHRKHFLDKPHLVKEDWEKFLDQNVVSRDMPIITLKNRWRFKRLLTFADETHFITSRQEKLRKITVGWIKYWYSVMIISIETKIDGTKKNGMYAKLHMRANSEMSAATHYKEKVLKKIITERQVKDNIIAIDDDPYVLNMYSRYGLALQAPECWNVLFHERPLYQECCLSV